MIDNAVKSLIKQELLGAIAYFIERQHLVAQAMNELDLNLNEVGKYKALAWVSHPDADTSKLDALYARATDEQERELIEVALRAQRRQLPQKGTWYDHDHHEWQYFLHGGGCSLINLQTGENIDWDCPDILAFDPYFFERHLEWQLTQPERHSQLKYTRQWLQHMSIDVMLKEMQAEGLINSDWTLPSYKAK